MAKLSDLKPATITVNINMVYAIDKDINTGRIISTQGRQVDPIKLRLLSKHEWEEIGFSVDDAVPPKDVNGKPDFLSMRYRQESARAELERNVRRLARALSCEGGLEFESAENDLEGRAQELRDIDTGVFNALFDQLIASAGSFQRQVETAAHSFRRPDGNGVLQAAASEDTA